MTTTEPTLRVHAIDPAELDDVRTRGADQFGHLPEEFLGEGGEQLRCCLRPGRPGERLWVIAHAPLTAHRPWREVGPVFVHAAPCAGYDPARGVPDLVRGRPLVLRSYTADQAMHHPGNRLIGPDRDVAAVLDELLADPVTSEVHLRNVEAQCFIARATR